MMDVDDAVMYLRESQSIGTGAYGEICPRCGAELDVRSKSCPVSFCAPLLICQRCHSEEKVQDDYKGAQLPLDKWLLVREVMGHS